MGKLLYLTEAGAPVERSREKPISRGGLSMSDLRPTSKQLWDTFRESRRMVKEDPKNRQKIFALLMAFEKWARRAWEGAIDLTMIDIVFDEMCLEIQPLADADAEGLAHYVRLLKQTRYTTMERAKEVSAHDLAVLTDTTEREARIQGILISTELDGEEVTRTAERKK